MTRFWLGGDHVEVGDTIRLSGGYPGSATIVAIAPIRGIDVGAWLIDSRSLLLVQCAGCGLHGDCYLAYTDPGLPETWCPAGASAPTRCSPRRTRHRRTHPGDQPGDPACRPPCRRP